MRCPACGSQVAPTARFCASCGHRLAGRTEERRLVTVLFADLVGFTTLSERRDPEQVKHLVDQCFSWLAADIVSFGGRVDKVLGDAIVALFGAPTAHEDDAERAVRAALTMQATLRRRGGELDHAVEMRVGVNSGEVLVGEMQAAGDYTAMGDVVNLASRLQTAAEPGEVLVGASTQLATARVIRYRARGPLLARGREEPIETYTAVEPAVAPGSRARSRVPMVGRDEELELLRHAAGNALRHRRAALLLVAGDAGMGKTRLADELAGWAAASFNTRGLEGRCLPYGEANVWWPIAEALRAAGNIELGAPMEQAARLLRALVGADLGVAPDAPEVERIADGLLQVLGYDEARRDPNPDRDREAVVAAVVALVEAVSRHQPVVMKLSDLHWADEVVLDLLGTVFERLPRHPILVIATTRRSLLDRWSPPSGRHDTVVVNLDALDGAAAGKLLDSLLSPEVVLSRDERRRLIERAGGNPFFLEELVSLASSESPTTPDDLPGTLRGLLTARLDRLPPTTRALVDDAAFIGRRGPVEALENMALQARGIADIRPTLDRLAEADLLEVDGDVWSFRSDLLREVAYTTLTKHERARRHRDIAVWLEDHLPVEISDSLVDQLANHWSTAAELSVELGSDGRDVGGAAVPALRWLGEAAERAERMRALQVAEGLYSRALRLLALLPADEVKPARRVALLVGRARARAEERDLAGAQRDVDAALALVADRADPASEAAALLVAGDVANKAGRLEQATDLLRNAAGRYELAGDLAGKAEALRTLALAEMFAGRFAEAERSGLAALEVFEVLDDPRRKAWSLQNLAWVMYQMERAEEAVRYLHESMVLFRDLNDRGGLHWAEGLYAFVCLQLGDVAEAERLQKRVLAASRNAGDRWASAMMLLLGALLHLWGGRTSAAVDEAREALAAFEAMDDRFGRGRAMWTLGRALIMAGDVSEGMSLLESTVAVVQNDPGGQGDADSARLVLASALGHLGEPDAALRAAGVGSDAVAVSDPVHFDELTPFLADDLAVASALAALQLGHLGAAREWLHRVPEKPSARSVLALLRAAEGDRGDAGNLASAIERSSPGTYVDRLYAGIAVGLAAAVDHDAAEAKRHFAALREDVDGTEDVLSQAIARLAEAAGLWVLGDPDAPVAEAEAEDAVRLHGAVGPGWATLLSMIVER